MKDYLIVELAGEEWAIAGDVVDRIEAGAEEEVELVDLRMAFGLPATRTKSIVIVRLAENRSVGLVVDGVRDLVQLPVEPPPDFGVPRWLAGVLRRDEGLALVLDPAELPPCSA